MTAFKNDLLSKLGFVSLLIIFFGECGAQDWKLTPANIDLAIEKAKVELEADSMRPAFHLTPPAGCMGDPNGGIYYNGWYHIFYGLHPFAFHPGGWYWAHARSKDLLHWEQMETGLTPAFELGLTAVGSGSTIITEDGKRLTFYSASTNGPLQFWQAEFDNENLSKWSHKEKDPILTLKHSGLPPFDGFWRDPFVFETEGRTFLIACADLFEESYVAVPIFEAKNIDLTEWEYKGNLFTVPKHTYRNLEVPELRPLGDKWIFMASTDAPVDRVNYFIGEFDPEQLKFIPESSGAIDYSGHYYAQETIQDKEDNLFLLAWMPGWDREWLPTYMNDPLKNRNPRWNGCFTIPRELSLVNGQLIQRPVKAIRQLRLDSFQMSSKELPVVGPMTYLDPVSGIRGNQLEIHAELELKHASFTGINVLCNQEGLGGLAIVWSGNQLNVDGVKVTINEWRIGNTIQFEIFVDKKFVEVFVNGGRYCITRQVKEENVKGDNIAMTSLGGTARLVSFKAWKLKSINRE